MSIIKQGKRRDKGFFMVSNSIVEDAELTWEARGVLCYLLSKPEDWTVRVADLENRGTQGKYLIRKVIKQLCEKGYMSKRPCRNSKGQVEGWDFTVYEEPQQKEGDSTVSGFHPSTVKTVRRLDPSTDDTVSRFHPSTDRTAPTNTEIKSSNTDQVTNTKKESKKKSLTERECIQMLPLHHRGPALQVAWLELMQLRKSNKQPISELALRKLVNKLDEFKDEAQIIRAIDKAIIGNYKSIFVPDETRSKQSHQTQEPTEAQKQTCREIVDLWNNLLGSSQYFAKAEHHTAQRRDAILGFYEWASTMENVEAVFYKLRSAKAVRNFSVLPSIDWISKPENASRVLEGVYDKQ